MDAGLIAMRMRLSGGKEVAAEAETATAAVEETSAATDAANKKVSRSGNAIRSSLSKQIGAIKTIGTSLTKYISVPLAAIAIGSGVMAAHFERSVLLLHTQAGVAKKDLAGLEKSFLKIGRETTFSPTEVSGAAYRLAGAGIQDPRDLERATRASAQLAMVGEANPEETAKTIAQIWYQRIKGAGDFNRIIKEVNATVGAGDLRLSQLIDALGTGVVASAKQAGLSMQDVNAAMAVFGDSTNNVSGWSAQFATALHYFTSPGEKATSAMERLGLAQFQLSSDLAKPHGLVVMLKDLRDHLEALKGGIHGDLSKQILGEILPGGRGRVMLSLLNAIPKLEEKYKRIKATSDEFNKSLRETEQTPQVKLERAWSSVRASLVEIGKVLLPIAVPLLQEAATVAAGIGHDFAQLSPATQHWVVKIGLIAAALGPVLVLVAKLVKAWQTISELSVVQKIGGNLSAGRVAAATAGTAASQIAGQAIGGKAGSAVSNIGTGAALGFGIGGPWGAAAGAGLGALLTFGPDLASLFSTEKKVNPMQLKLQQSAKGMAEAYRTAQAQVRALKASEDAVTATQRNHHAATQAVTQAQHELNAARRQSGPNSQAAIRAEIRYGQAIRGVTAAKRAQRRAEREQGVELEVTKEKLRFAILEERHRINVLGQARGKIEAHRQALKAEGATLQQLQPTNERLSHVTEQLRQAQQRQAQTTLEAAKVAGPRFAQMLKQGSRATVEYGSKIKAARHELLTMKSALAEVRRAVQATDNAFERGTLEQRGNLLREGIENSEGKIEGLEKHPRRQGGHHRKDTAQLEETKGSKLLAELVKPRNRGPQRETKQVILALDRRGRRRLAEVVVEEQEDEDAHS